MKTEAKEAYVAMPGLNGLVTIIEFPNMKDDELARAIKLEAHKYIPASLDEVYLSWDIVSKVKTGLAREMETAGNKYTNRGNSDKIQVLLVAAPKKEVARYEGIITDAGIKTKSLELDTFSTVRSMVGEDLGTFLLIEIGARIANVILIEKGVVKISHNVDVGGNDITKTIADSMNLSWSRVEEFKKQGEDFLGGKKSVVIAPTLELIAGEAARMIKAYKDNSGDQARVDSVIISGGTSKLKGINKYFSDYLGIKSVSGNPWKRIEYDEKLKPIVEKMGPSFAVSLGLALKGIEDYQRRV